MPNPGDSDLDSDKTMRLLDTAEKIPVSEVIQGLHNREWLSGIFERLKLTPLTAGLFMLCINLIIDVPLALRFNVMLPLEQASIKGLIGEPSDWLYEFLVYPIIFAYFSWVQIAGKRLFGKLEGRDIVGSDEHLEHIVVRLRDQLQSRWAIAIGVVASIVFVVWVTWAFNPILRIPPYEVAPYPSWLTADPAIAFIRAPVVFVVFYALAIIVYDLLFIILALRAAIKDQAIRVEPLNPDRAGGLGFIGGFSADLSYLIFALGALLVARTLRNVEEFGDLAGALNVAQPSNYVFLLGIVAYLFVSPVVFMWPLWTAHQAMVRYRDSLLDRPSRRFSELLSRVRESSWSDESHSENLLKQIKQLEEVQESISERVPVWPFNAGTLGKYFGIVFSPLLAAFISALIDLVLGF
jgi:hypothetical protein